MCLDEDTYTKRTIVYMCLSLASTSTYTCIHAYIHLYNKEERGNRQINLDETISVPATFLTY